MFLLAIVPQTPETEELLSSLYITANTSGFGLLLTAIIQTVQHQLSLFHAIFIIHILFFLGTGVSPKGKCSELSSYCAHPLPSHAGRYQWTTSRAVMALLVRLVSLISLITWGLYLWVNVKDFGSQPECNDQIKYVVLFCTVRATANWLRHVWIAIFAIPCALVAVMLFGMTATIIFILKRLKKQRRAGGSNSTVQRTTPQTQPYVVENHWYLRLDTRRILCVAPPLSLIGHSRITA
jgi:hypothetical protein